MCPLSSSATRISADASVHHVGGCNDVRAGIGVRYGLAHEHVDRDVIQHIALVIDDPVLTVSRVRIERNVGHDGELRQGFLDCTYRALHQAVRVGAFSGIEALLVLVNDGEQGHGRDAEIAGFRQLLEQQVDAFA